MSINPNTAAVALAVALVIACAGCGSNGTGSTPPMQVISTDPYDNTDTWHATEVESDSFAYGGTIVATFQAGRASNGGASNIGWARSADGGVTWSHGFLSGLTRIAGGMYDRVTDSVVAYDAFHDVWMISSIGFDIIDSRVGPPAELFVSRSTDGGRTWQNPISLERRLTQPIQDKNWTVCDNHPASPFYGYCYTQYSDPSSTPDGYPLVMRVQTSTDGGLTWGPALGVDVEQYGGGGQPVVQPSGNVVVPFEQLSREDQSFDAMASFRSTDGGLSWGDTVQIAPVRVAYRAQNDIRLGVLPSATVDDNGRVYVVWNDCQFESGCTANDVVLSSSIDGLNWTPPARVPVNPVGSGRSQMLPAIEVKPGTSGESAHLALVTYYIDDAQCSTDRCWLRAAYLSSVNGGQSWSTKTHLGSPMRLPWFPNTSSGRMFGDYMAISFALDGMAVPIIPLARPPIGSVMDVTMQATRLPVTGGTQR